MKPQTICDVARDVARDVAHSAADHMEYGDDCSADILLRHSVWEYSTNTSKDPIQFLVARTQR